MDGCNLIGLLCEKAGLLSVVKRKNVPQISLWIYHVEQPFGKPVKSTTYDIGDYVNKNWYRSKGKW